MTWRDAYSETDEGDYEGDDFVCETVGYLLPETEHFVRLAQERTPAGFRSVTAIPKPLILNREVLSGSSVRVGGTHTK